MKSYIESQCLTQVKVKKVQMKQRGICGPLSSRLNPQAPRNTIRNPSSNSTEYPRLSVHCDCSKMRLPISFMQEKLRKSIYALFQ